MHKLADGSFRCSRDGIAVITAPHVIKRLVGCITAADFVWESELTPIGLKKGDSAQVQVTRGTMPGFLPSPGLYNVVIYSNDGKRGALLFALSTPQGGCEVTHQGYVLSKDESGWTAEGSNGPPEYEAVAKFVESLENQANYKVRLVPGSQGCTVAPP